MSWHDATCRTAALCDACYHAGDERARRPCTCPLRVRAAPVPDRRRAVALRAVPSLSAISCVARATAVALAGEEDEDDDEGHEDGEDPREMETAKETEKREGEGEGRRWRG